MAIKHHGEILTRVCESMPIQPKPAQKIAYATLLLNFAVACAKKNTNVDMKLVILDTLNTKIGNFEFLILLLNHPFQDHTKPTQKY